MRLMDALRRALGLSPPPEEESVKEIIKRKHEVLSETRRNILAAECERRSNRMLEEAVEMVQGRHRNGHAHD